jgi:DNA-directed RNA polymerase specialized sigma24 family protein
LLRDVRPFEALYDRYSSQALALAVRTGRRDAAEDATQAAWSRWSRP